MGSRGRPDGQHHRGGADPSYETARDGDGNSYRARLGVIRLADRCGRERVDAACARAVTIGMDASRRDIEASVGSRGAGFVFGRVTDGVADPTTEAHEVACPRAMGGRGVGQLAARHDFCQSAMPSPAAPPREAEMSGENGGRSTGAVCSPERERIGILKDIRAAAQDLLGAFGLRATRRGCLRPPPRLLLARARHSPVLTMNAICVPA